MNTATWRRHRMLNIVQSALLLAAMAAILCGLGWLIAGQAGIAWAAIGGLALVLINPGISPGLILRMYGATPISARQAPGLHRLNAALAERAGLSAVPRIYYVPSAMLNAFTIGSRDHPAIVLTDGLLHGFSSREIAAVMAHEMSHVRNNDIWVMGLADLFSRLTGIFSIAGQVLLLFSLPLLLFTEHSISWLAIALLILAPTASGLIQLALSRAREYDADLGAAELTGDPRGLALALHKMQRYEGGFVEQIFFPGRRVPEPSLLRSHPPTQSRIQRLLQLTPGAESAAGIRLGERLMKPVLPAVERRPRWRASGVWY